MRTLLVAYIIIILAWVCWPYGFVFPCRICKNGASWNVNENRIEFESAGVVRSVSPPIGLYERLTSGTGLSIEVWMKAASLNQDGPARIVSYSHDPFYRNFTLGQINRELIFRLRTTATDLNGTSPEIAVPGVFALNKQQQIAISCDFTKCRIYVDGHHRESVRIPGGTFQNWDATHQLLIGNEQTGDRPWIGGIESVVLYERPISDTEVMQSYESGGTTPGRSGVVAAFDFIPSQGAYINDKSGVKPPTQLELLPVFTNDSMPDFLSLKPRDTRDFVSNFLVFMPFGFLLLLNLPYKGDSALLTVAAIFLATVPVVIITESLQYYVDARTSSLFDLASCLAGSLAGSLAAIVARPVILSS